MHPFQIIRFALLAAFFAGAPGWAQTVAPASSDEASALTFAEKAAVRALDFQKGDLASLTDVKDDFTPSAWHDFLKQFEGFLDAKGAPQYSSEFEPSRPPVVVRHENGVVTLTIPGKLTQTHLKSRTTYRLVVTVQVSGNPPKIAHFEQTTCGGHSTAAACK
ncbi:MAG TPA: hypothetical protein VEU52_08665 [Candidatus Limnocylindrales bacterium]|nr:hypothetical protein [Candidatus Limnocylindrales bacterium]